MSSTPAARPPRGSFRPTIRIEPIRRGDRRKPAWRALQPGEILGGYEIVDVIAEGGTAHVYRAYHATLDRYLAIKVLKGGLPDSAVDRFWREAALGATFSHQNLARVVDAGRADRDGVHWMAMDYERGGDLGQLLDTGKTLPPRHAIDVMTQVLHALEHVHVRGVVHCDLKPENILLTRDSRDRRIIVVKLVDFGIHRDLIAPVHERHLSGDPRYMAPEQQQRNGPLDGRADVYGAGLCLYELVTGTHPFAGVFSGSLESLMLAHRHHDPRPPSEMLPYRVRHDVAEALDDVILRACAKSPLSRFADAATMRDALARLHDRIAAGAVAA